MIARPDGPRRLHQPCKDGLPAMDSRGSSLKCIALLFRPRRRNLEHKATLRRPPAESEERVPIWTKLTCHVSGQALHIAPISVRRIAIEGAGWKNALTKTSALPLPEVDLMPKMHGERRVRTAQLH